MSAFARFCALNISSKRELTQLLCPAHGMYYARFGYLDDVVSLYSANHFVTNLTFSRGFPLIESCLKERQSLKCGTQEYMFTTGLQEEIFSETVYAFSALSDTEVCNLRSKEDVRIYLQNLRVSLDIYTSRFVATPAPTPVETPVETFWPTPGETPEETPAKTPEPSAHPCIQRVVISDDNVELFFSVPIHFDGGMMILMDNEYIQSATIRTIHVDGFDDISNTLKPTCTHSGNLLYCNYSDWKRSVSINYNNFFEFENAPDMQILAFASDSDLCSKTMYKYTTNLTGVTGVPTAKLYSLEQHAYISSINLRTPSAFFYNSSICVKQANANANRVIQCLSGTKYDFDLPISSEVYDSIEYVSESEGQLHIWASRIATTAAPTLRETPQETFKPTLRETFWPTLVETLVETPAETIWPTFKETLRETPQETLQPTFKPTPRESFEATLQETLVKTFMPTLVATPQPSPPLSSCIQKVLLSTAGEQSDKIGLDLFFSVPIHFDGEMVIPIDNTYVQSATIWSIHIDGFDDISNTLTSSCTPNGIILSCDYQTWGRSVNVTYVNRAILSSSPNLTVRKILSEDQIYHC
jgi:hypothetical protein